MRDTVDPASRPKTSGRPRVAEPRLGTLLASSLDNLLEGVQIIGSDWRYLYVNARAAEHGRTTPEQLLGRTMMECYPGIEQTEVFTVLRRVMETREAANLHNEFAYADGKRCSFDLRVTPVPQGICVFTVDITEQARAQAALSQREEELRIIADNVRDLMFLASSNGRLLYTNPAFERLLGYDQEQLAALSPVTLIHPDDLTRLQDWPRVPRAEFRVRHSNGTWVWLEGFSQVLAQSRKGLVAGIVRDITDRRIMEETLRNDEARTRFAMGVAKMGVWQLDVSTGAIWWSETLEDTCHLPRGQGPKTWAEFADRIHCDDLPQVQEALVKARETATVFHVEFRFTAPSGEPLWLQASGQFVYAEGKPQRLLGMGIDVTERRMIETQLRQAQKFEAIGQLAGGIAHDFNNLLTAISGFGQIVADSFAKEDPRRQDMDEVLGAATRAQTLTRQLLAFSRKQTLQPTVVDLNSIVAGMERLLGRLLGANVKLVAHLDPSAGAVFVDVHQIEHAIINLVVNARDAMPDGGTVSLVTTTQDFADAYTTRDFELPPGQYALLAVTDTGVGMVEETRSRVFEPFFTTKGTKGTGLGLASVYGSVKQLGGYINVYSEPELGTTFKIYFPRRDENGVSVPARETQAPPQGTETLLVVEDDASVRTLLVTLLTQLGYRIIVAASAVEACQYATNAANTIDLVLSDVIMPQMNGLEMVTRIQRLRPDTRVLFISGYSEYTLAQFSLAHSSYELLQKPFDSHTLAVAVRRALDRTPA